MISVYLSQLDLLLIITIPVVILIGLVIFFFAGIHRVPKNHAIVITKAGQYYCYYTKGIHFKFPIVYQRAATYCIVPQVRKYVAENGNHLDITYCIKDVEKYHNNRILFNDLMKRIEKENSEINLTTLKSSFEQYGLEFISIKKSLN